MRDPGPNYIRQNSKYYYKNVNNDIFYTPYDDLIIHEGTPRKFVLGNNGNFNLNDKNMFRILAPTLLGTYLYGNTK